MTDQLTRPEETLRVNDEFDAILAGLEAIDPLLRAEAAASEAAGQLTPTVERALVDAGAFDLALPRELGGLECSPRQILEAVAVLSRADASSGWVAMTLQMVVGTTAAYLGETAVAELDPRHRVFAAGQGTRPGSATTVEGGYLVSGSWQFASGIKHCTHVHTAAVVAETGLPLVFTLPKEQATFVENWDVMGLRATGSIDYRLDEVFVPAEHAYVATTTEPLVGGSMFRLGLANMAGLCHAGWAMGVGRRLLDEMRLIAVAKSGTPGGVGIDSAEFHADIARAEGRFRAACAWNREVWADNEATLATGSELTTDQETLTRLALHEVTHAAGAVGETVYRWAGTAALREGPLNRVFRDLHGGTQHVTSGPGVRQGCGKRLAGLAPDARWVFLSLVEEG